MTRLAAALGLAALTVTLAACSDRSGSAQAKPAAPPPVPVGATTVEQKVMPVMERGPADVRVGIHAALQRLRQLFQEDRDAVTTLRGGGRLKRPRPGFRVASCDDFRAVRGNEVIEHHL